MAHTQFVIWLGNHKRYVAGAVDLHLFQGLFSRVLDDLELQCFLCPGPLFCCSFFCRKDQFYETMQAVQVAGEANNYH